MPMLQESHSYGKEQQTAKWHLNQFKLTNKGKKPDIQK